MSSREKVPVEGLTKALLGALTVGAIITTALIFPGVGFLIREFKRERWEKAKKRGVLMATIRRLERQKLVSWQEKDGKTILTITDRGKEKLLQYDIDNMKLKKSKKWDGLFRIVIFDIPNKKRKAREMLRKKLKELEFYPLQESVFVTPFECRDEIDFLRHYFEIVPFVKYIVAKEISDIDINLWFKTK